MNNKATDFGDRPPINSLRRDLQLKIDGMFDDQLERAVVGLKQKIDAENAELLMMDAEYDRRRISSTEHKLSTTAWLKIPKRSDA